MNPYYLLIAITIGCLMLLPVPPCVGPTEENLKHIYQEERKYPGLR